MERTPKNPEFRNDFESLQLFKYRFTFKLMLYIHVNNFSVKLGFFPGLNQYIGKKVKYLA